MVGLDDSEDLLQLKLFYDSKIKCRLRNSVHLKLIMQKWDTVSEEAHDKENPKLKSKFQEKSQGLPLRITLN